MSITSTDLKAQIYHAENPTGTNEKPYAIPSQILVPPLPAPGSEKRTKRRAPPEPTSPHPRTSKRICTRPNKPNLRLFTRDVKFALPLAPSKRERTAPGPPADEATTTALGQCVDLALRLLEEGRGNRMLVAVGRRIVAERRAEAARVSGAAVGIYKGDIRDMPMWVERFLRQVREVGIPICVCESLSGYGLTQRWGWGSDMENYDCWNSAIVYIHKSV